MSGWFSSGSHSQGSGTAGRPPHDITSGSQLNSLYNRPVVEVEQMRRPLTFLPDTYGPFSHSGVRVTLDDGRQYLIHKGSNFGTSSQTVVVDAKHMSDHWQVEDKKSVHGTTVGDLVQRGGTDYSLSSDNCHDAANRMMKK